MKTDPSSAWTNLVQRARRDTPGPLDTAALLHTLPPVATPAPTSPLHTFLDDFAALFATRRALAVCAAALVACAVLGGWQLHSEWQDIEPLASLIGGVS